MAVFKEFSAEDVKTNKSYLNQLVDILGSDISGSSTRKQYQVFVTGGLGPGVTSSLFQTVFDQDFTLQTANAIFDTTFGLHTGSEVVTYLNPTIDSNGKYLFPANSLMMREKMDIYRLFAQNLLGDSNAMFTAISGSTSYNIKEAMFICFKRLFSRDQVKRETFAIRYYASGASLGAGQQNLAKASSNGSFILTDINSSVNKEYEVGGQVSTVVDSANIANPLGLLFLDKGILVLDISRSFDQAGPISGAIDCVTNTAGIVTNFTGTLKNLMSSGSMDEFLDHVCSTRFTGSDETSITFQNITNINSTLFFCRAGADEFNYSSNPTFTDENNRITVIDPGQEETQRTFTFVTSIGLYDSTDNLLAVAKMSRPVKKDDERDVTFKVRLDFVRKNNKRKIIFRNR
jgi:hypothetical protein